MTARRALIARAHCVRLSYALKTNRQRSANTIIAQAANAVRDGLIDKDGGDMRAWLGLLGFAALGAVIMSACGGIADVDQREWELMAQSIEDGTESLREYAALVAEIETSMRMISELGREIPSSEDLRIDAADFKRSNDVIAQGIKRRADALRDYAAAMREAKTAIGGLDEAGGAPAGLWSGAGFEGASEEQLECYFGLIYRSNSYPGGVSLAYYILSTDPEDMDVVERRWLDRIFSNWGGDLIDHCDDYIYGGP